MGGGGLGGVLDSAVGVVTGGSWTPGGKGYLQGNDPIKAWTNLVPGLGGKSPTNANNTQIDMFGRPILEDFKSNIDPATGLMKEQYNVKDTYDPRAINSMRETALRAPGEQSKWAEMAQANAGNQIAKQQAGQLAGAQSGLAMQGGLRTGARERLASQSMQSGLMNKQNAFNQIAGQDEQNRLGQLGQLVGQEGNLAQYQTGLQSGNIGRATSEIGQNRAYDMNRYNEAMKAWAAQQSANAIPQTEDKGFLGNLMGGFGF